MSCKSETFFSSFSLLRGIDFGANNNSKVLDIKIIVNVRLKLTPNPRFTDRSKKKLEETEIASIWTLFYRVHAKRGADDYVPCL